MMEKLQTKWMQKTGPHHTDLSVSGYASVFDFTDSYNDIIVKGAFASTILNNGCDVKFLWQHDHKFPIGKITKLQEDDYGLYIEASITSGTEKGREAIDLLSKNIINGLSIGFNIISSHQDKDDKRIITKLELWEISLVTFPANQQSQIEDISISKSAFLSALEDANMQISLINKRSKSGYHY